MGVCGATETPETIKRAKCHCSFVRSEDRYGDGNTPVTVERSLRILTTNQPAFNRFALMMTFVENSHSGETEKNSNSLFQNPISIKSSASYHCCGVSATAVGGHRADRVGQKGDGKQTFSILEFSITNYPSSQFTISGIMQNPYNGRGTEGVRANVQSTRADGKRGGSSS
ncbi:hypothetical protein CBL_12646 [Carabus blaptoides fortunei]